MSSEAKLDVQPTSKIKIHSPPRLAAVSKSLVFSYTSSPDGIDSNLLILLHGLGDTVKPFAALGKSLKLPQTAVLAIQAPKRVPLLEEDAWMWYESWDELGEPVLNPNPTPAMSLLASIVEQLTGACQWELSQLHFFGNGQGGSLAAQYALSSPSLGSVVTVGGPLLSAPGLGAGKKDTPVCAVYRAGQEKEAGVKELKRAFVKATKAQMEERIGAQAMPGSRADWEPIMRFWAQVLTHRSAMEFEKDVYEVKR